MTPTSTLTILGQSLRSMVRRWPVLLTLYGMSLFIVLPVVLAFRATLANAFLTSPVIERMFTEFDYTTYADFLSSQRGAVEFFQRTIGPFMFVSFFLHGLVGAGVVAAMAGEGTVADFLRATGRYLGRSFRLVIYAIVVGVIVILLWSFGIAAVWGAMTSGDTIESGYVTAAVIVVALFLLPVAILSLATEYSRVIIVREDRRQVLRTFFEGFRFVFQHPVRMIIQHGFILITMLVFVGLYWVVEAEVGMTTAGGILAMLAIQQVSVLARIGIRVWHTASAVALVDAITPEVPVAVAAPAPTLAASIVATPAPASAPITPASATAVKAAPRRRKPATATKKVVRKSVKRPRSR